MPVLRRFVGGVLRRVRREWLAVAAGALVAFGIAAVAVVSVESWAVVTLAALVALLILLTLFRRGGTRGSC